jgi:hypothetical protein
VAAVTKNDVVQPSRDHVTVEKAVGAISIVAQTLAQA